MRIVFIQHGDYRETVFRFLEGKGETCGSQRYSVEFVARLCSAADEVAVLCVTAGPYDEMLPNGVRGIGMPIRGTGAVGFRGLTARLEAASPTHLVLRSPMTGVLRWAADRGVRCLPMLADSFGSGVRGWVGRRRLGRQLRRGEFPWVGNHNLNASRSLARLGVDPGRIIPWDWPPTSDPAGEPVLQPRVKKGPRRLLYVGSLIEAKGLPDAITALSIVRARGFDVELTVVGAGDQGQWRELAGKEGVSDQVTFTGRIEHDRVIGYLREHDIAVVPSRHDYPEGFPKTVNDAFSMRIPLLLSDHPVFAGRVRDGVGALFFRGSNPEHLAERIAELLEDDALYESLSESALEAFRAIECPAKWGDVILRWLKGRPEDREWLRKHTLAAMEE